ncbi:hypothetical protein ABZ944_40135 [Streptomyces flaveolus]
MIHVEWNYGRDMCILAICTAWEALQDEGRIPMGKLTPIIDAVSSKQVKLPASSCPGQNWAAQLVRVGFVASCPLPVAARRSSLGAVASPRLRPGRAVPRTALTWAARGTARIPPWPRIRASAPIISRRCRSSRCGNNTSNFTAS